MDIGACDNDSYGQYVDFSADVRWEAGMLGSAKDTRVVYQAEKVMATAIGYSPDDRVTIESIFKQRTKSNSEDFSFWG